MYSIYYNKHTIPHLINKNNHLVTNIREYVTLCLQKLFGHFKQLDEKWVQQFHSPILFVANCNYFSDNLKNETINLS